MLNDVVGQRVMVQQGSLVRGKAEQNRVLVRSRCCVSARSTFPLSVHPDLRCTVRKGTVYRTLNRHHFPWL